MGPTVFLTRKFAQPHDAPSGQWRGLPERVRDVVENLDLLLDTKRGVGHVFPDFGFSQSGQWSAEGLITHYTSELRENVARYEPRLEILEIDGEVNDEGWPELIVEARIREAEGTWRIVIDLVRHQISRVGNE